MSVGGFGFGGGPGDCLNDEEIAAVVYGIAGRCPSCHAKDAEIARLTQARDTALEALERERSARRGMA